MNKRRIAVCVGIIMMLTLSVLVVSNHPPESTVKELEQPAKFVLAEWDFPDEYGQGIEGIEIYENSTSSWVMYDNPLYDEETNFDWNASVAIKLRVFTWFNSTLTGAGSSNEGKLYQRHSVTVTSLGTTVFSKQNFTFVASDTGIDPPMWFYSYDVVLDFLPVAGEIYTVVVTYEIYW